ncbi:MAG TPA: sugar transferase [Tetrasphaera sp.]|uniref:sugar transferase n=1 Tax=Nostocoides sp. TaxID=1917966 RepID=UPI002CEED95F|nr:sugar transferase [Tetrasphaera sp.]HNQ07715.1 sugar transferase [Tetrasphaera sp.]
MAGRGADLLRGLWWAKDGFDRLAPLALLLTLSPLLLIVALWIRLDSPGSPIYTQERIGINGKAFRIWKFRSMRPGADAELRALLEATGNDGTPLFKPETDPRITRVEDRLRGCRCPRRPLSA